MKNLSYKEIRELYISFMKSNNHEEISNASLVPDNDPSVLFVNAGMFPLVPFLQGEIHPKGTRLTNVQRCLRTGDIEAVGDSTHCTTFEMLGNWSLNDYFKKEAITLTVQFFVEQLGFDINKIYASIFKGEDNIPKDTQSETIWTEIFNKYNLNPQERIFEYGKEKNWWGLPSGGPCGPDSEIFFDTGKEPCGNDCHINCDCGKYVELGNNVFMEYLMENGQYKPLGRHNVDFGGGLDRLTMISQNVQSIFETDIYKPILDKVIEISKEQNIFSQRVIVDHVKAATWIVMDGVIPGKTQQGYILRRLIRRAVRHSKTLNIQDLFTKQIAEICINQFKEIYPQLEEKKDFIVNTIEEEEIKFNKTVKNGLKEFDKLIQNKTEINGTETFKIYETYGFPIEMTIEELQNRNIIFDKEKLLQEFEQAKQDHQEKSRTASAGMFKGGLADTSENTIKYHTTTHLLLKALQTIINPNIMQKGSNITTERLRFDFNNDQKLTEEQIKEIETLVNEQIKKELPVTFEQMPKEEALKLVPNAAFSEKYDNIVKVYYVGPKENPFSVEICNGPHIQNTKELGEFKVVKQENVGTGIKRIKAILK